MACHAPTEEVDDHDREFLAAAVEDDTLVAKLLIRLSRSEARIVWRQLPGISKPPPPPPADAKDGIPAAPPPTRARLPQAGTWGRRRARSMMAFSTDGGSAGSKREGERRSSPGTPLSWSGASGTSGSAGEEGWSTPSRPPKRRKGRWVQGHGESSPPPPPPDRRTEVYRGGAQIQVLASLEVGAPAVAVGTPAVSGSAKAAAAAVRLRAPPRAAAHMAPLRLGSRGDGANWAVMRRQGKKKTVPELRAMTESLLREQQELQKELGKQKEVYDALLGENMVLKKLESNLSSLTTGKPTVAVELGEAKPEEPQHIHSGSERQALIELGTATVAHAEGNLEQTQCRRSTSFVPGFLFDLNCSPDSNL